MGDGVSQGSTGLESEASGPWAAHGRRTSAYESDVSGRHQPTLCRPVAETEAELQQGQAHASKHTLCNAAGPTS
eukprot:354656-Chlamydomonas_euryale.AAC.3